jgi:ABC-type uncharacterized transport system fused permease/ATPase subunit
MKFLKTLYTKACEKAKDALTSIRQTAQNFSATAVKIKNITQPFLKKVFKEKISIPVIRLHISKGVAIAVSYVGIHCLEFWLMRYFSTFANQPASKTEQLNGHSETPSSTATTFSHLMIACGNIVMNISLFSMKRALSYYLRNSVETALKDKMAKSWLSHKASTGITYLQEIEGNEMLPVSEIFSNHIAMCTKSMSLALNSSGDIISIIICLLHLKALFSNPKLVMHLLGYCIALAALQYKLFNKDYEELFTDISKKSSEINSQIINIQQFGMQTVAFQGEIPTQQKLLASFREREFLSKKLILLEIKSQSIFNGLTQAVSPLLDFVFPELASFSFTNRAGGYFYNQILSVLTDKTINLANLFTQELPAVKVSVDQVDQFNRLMKQWSDFKRLNLLEQAYDKKSLHLSVLCFRVHIFDRSKKDTIKDASKILKNPNLLWGGIARTGVSCHFKKGKVYLFPDLSGRGKTTILKAFLGLYPLASGKVVLPCKPEEVRFVSRNTFLPLKSTLLEAITFPDIPNKANEKAIQELIKIYIDKVGFEKPEKYREALLEPAEWSTKLSDGEKQRFAIIGVLIKRPKVLVLDEALGNLDVPSKFLIEKLIKQELKDTIILYADHHPVPGFVDFVVRIDKGNLSCIKEEQYDYPYQMFHARHDKKKNKLATLG